MTSDKGWAGAAECPPAPAVSLSGDGDGDLPSSSGST